jgi:catechol 2,3-dioxygenase-like lactoylglutathione lyase family enzyme
VSIVSIQHVQVNVPAERAEEARHFYGELLGLEAMERPGSLSEAGRAGAWYRVGEWQEVHLYFNPEGGFDPAASSQHPAFIVDDLAGLRSQLSGAGLALEEAIPIAGRERFFARDPGGNRIEFLALAAD